MSLNIATERTRQRYIRSGKLGPQATALVIDASPLWELQYTGISNVTYEITRRAVAEARAKNREVHVTAVGREVPSQVLDACLDERSGRLMRTGHDKRPSAANLERRLAARKGLAGTVGLYLNIKPTKKVHDREAMMFYDFSPLLVPECHTADTIAYHTAGIGEQVATCDRMFCISESTARDLKWIFDVLDEKVHVALLGNSVETEVQAAVHERLDGEEIEPFLLMLGTIEPRKNIGVVLQWLADNRDVLERYCVVFAGRQGWGEPLGVQLRAFDLMNEVERGRIIAMDYVDEARKAALLAGAAGLLYPSLFEGFGLPVLEAMDAGVPVLSSVSTSLPEVLGECGYYFDPYSTDSLHTAFETFDADGRTEERAAVVKRAKTRAATFDYDRTYEVVRYVLDELADEVVSGDRRVADAQNTRTKESTR